MKKYIIGILLIISIFGIVSSASAATTITINDLNVANWTTLVSTAVDGDSVIFDNVNINNFSWGG